MSCYEWESGDIKIPAKEWSGLKKAVRDAWNLEQGKKLERALRLYDSVIAKGKGKRGFDYRTAVRYTSGTWDIDHALFPYDDLDRKKPLKPKKKDFPLAGNNQTDFSFGDGSVSFDNKTKTVRWYVDENNHARDHARSHPVGAALFRALDRITWTNKTGGVIVGNDEYNRDDRDYGGGGNYVTQTFGGIGRRAHKDLFGW